jgi:sugar/nucleoside kinase (ribokinase family)
MKGVTPLGKMTLFYVPSHKLDVPGPGKGATPRAEIHDFLMRHYKAYTHTPSPVKGFWLDEDRAVVHDVLERFEVSFGSEQEFERLVAFLRQLCRALGEQAIYLTRGEESFLVSREGG